MRFLFLLPIRRTRTEANPKWALGVIIVKNIATSMELFCPYWLVLLNKHLAGAMHRDRALPCGSGLAREGGVTFNFFGD
jgi:hypothetical protein